MINPQRRVTKQNVIAQRCINFMYVKKSYKQKINELDLIWCLDEVGIYEGAVEKNTQILNYIGDHEVKMKDVQNYTLILIKKSFRKTRIAVILKNIKRKLFQNVC